MSEISADTLAQIPKLAAEGLPAGRIAFLLHLSDSVVQEELQRLGRSVTTTKEKSKPRLNIGSMSADTKYALARFEAVTGLQARRFKSNRHAMQYWFSVWVDRNNPIVQKAIDEYPDIKSINGLPFDFLTDFGDKEVQFDIDRGELLK